MTRDISPTDIEIQGVEHHRNGVGGWPFWVVTFKYTDNDRNPRLMVATAFATGNVESDHPRAFEDCMIAVLDRFDPMYAWRGDVFAEHIISAIQKKYHDWIHAEYRDIPFEGRATCKYCKALDKPTESVV